MNEVEPQANLSARKMLICGALIIGAGVALGAIGSHALETYLMKSITVNELGEATNSLEIAQVEKRLKSWDTGVRYQIYHGLAILVLGAIFRFHNHRLSRIAFFLILAGVVMFSGMLYAYVLSQQKIFVMIVPLGGVSFIAAWVCLFLSFWQMKK